MAAHHHAICDEGSDGSRWFVSNGHKVMTALSSNCWCGDFLCNFIDRILIHDRSAHHRDPENFRSLEYCTVFLLIIMRILCSLEIEKLCTVFLLPILGMEVFR